MALSVQSDRHLVPAAEAAERHLLVRLTAPETRKPRAKRKPARLGVNVCFVLDRSGSMAGDKLALVRYAVERAVSGLSDQDRFAIVTFDDRIEVLAKSRKATDAAKREAVVRLRSVDARGTTNLHGGWERGASLVKGQLNGDAVNRVLVLTDGLANVGETSPSVLQAFADDLRASGVATTTFGVGADFDESLLQSLADAGGGHFYFIERPEQIPDYMTGELGELLDTVARQVVLNVKHAAGLGVRALSPVVARAAGPGEMAILLGDVVAGQDVELVLAVDFPPAGSPGSQTTLFFTVADRDGALKADGCSIDFESAERAACEAETPNAEVERAVDWLRAALARQEAVAMNRAGRFGDASEALSQAAARMRRHGDAGSRGYVSELALEAQLVAAPMSELDRKSVHYRGANLARSRDAQGRAQRRA